MEKVKNEKLITKLNSRYAEERTEYLKGVERREKAWFYVKEDQAFYLRAMYGEKPGPYLHMVSDSSLK